MNLIFLLAKYKTSEFISFINRTNTSLSIQIPPSIFETNSFLMGKTPTLIEYALFYGSIQIIQYLRYSEVPLINSMWLYSIHSNNAELIHFLEENVIKPFNYNIILEESITCHHNAIADYIKDNFLDKTTIDCFGSCIVKSHNYYYLPTDILNIISKSPNKNYLLEQFKPKKNKITKSTTYMKFIGDINDKVSFLTIANANVSFVGNINCESLYLDNCNLSDYSDEIRTNYFIVDPYTHSNIRGYSSKESLINVKEYAITQVDKSNNNKYQIQYGRREWYVSLSIISTFAVLYSAKTNDRRLY